jgi:phenylacetate-CoA ligase
MGFAKYSSLFSLLGNERRSREELERLQRRKLSRIVHDAYRHVPFYRDIFDSRGLKPGDITTVEDLQKLPVVDKRDYQRAGQAQLLSSRFRDKAKHLELISTSGSTGAPLSFLVDAHCASIRKAQFLRPYLTNGRTVADRVLRFSQDAARKPTWLQRLGLMREWRVLSSATLGEQVQALIDLRPTVLQSFPSCLVSIASFILDRKIAIHPPRLVFSDSELLTAQHRRIIEAGFRSPVLDVFGTYETDNIAYECDHHRGYHIAIDCVVMEFVKNDRRVKPGEEGEIVCTVLDNLAMPFIRYNLHDIGIYTDEPCTCKRTFPVMQMIAGRSVDLVMLPDGQTQSPASFLVRFDPLAALVHEFQVIQRQLDHFEVLIVPSGQLEEVKMDHVRSLIRHDFPGVGVDVTVVERIPREPSGKVRPFVSQVPR